MRSPLFDDVDLEPDQERLAGDLARQLDAAGSAMDVAAPPFGSLVLAPRRRHRHRPLVAAAVALTLVGAGVVVTRGNEVADLPVSTGASTSLPDPQPPTRPAVPVGWRVELDPATGFLPTSALDPALSPPPDLSEPPGYRDGVLYTQHWLGAFFRPVDPLGGPLLAVETDFEPIGGVPGRPPIHPEPSFTIASARGPVPAWEWPTTEGAHRFGFMGDDEHIVTVGAFGMTREEAIAAVADLTIGERGAAVMPTPSGLVGQRVYETSNESAYVTYADGDGDAEADAAADAAGPHGRQVDVAVIRGSTGPDLLEAAQSFFLGMGMGMGMGVLPASAPEAERVTVDGRSALLRRHGEGTAELITYDPEGGRTISLRGQGGVGDDELIALATQLRDIDDATWSDLVDRCQDVRPGGPTRC